MTALIHGRSLAEWTTAFPLISSLTALKPVSWFNPEVATLSTALQDMPLTRDDVADASARLQRFAPLLADLFPDVREAKGIIESPLRAVPKFAEAVANRYGTIVPKEVFLKQDSHLPIAGSIKARGGIYEVLHHAEQLALSHGLLTLDGDYRTLGNAACRALFQRHSIAVGSTGNLGMSIGIASATLGFTTTVHMSADARQWKKDRLRAHGVTVVEYEGDYGQAVEQGRALAEADPTCHFVDDENSRTLFLGYAVAGERLKAQLDAIGREVNAAHPLFVYLPCGVGGGPGGVAFGLKLAFGDAVHCIFAEPTHSPCMLLGVHTGLHDGVAVQDFGIDNVTAADGLAVGRPSGFVGRAMQRMLDGYYTVSDETLYALLATMDQTEQIRLEPSALAGAPGFAHVLSEDQGYRARMHIGPVALENACHVIWATGGGMVPESEMAAYLENGRTVLNTETSA